MVKKCVKKFLETFEGKTLPRKWGKSEISRWSNQLENVIFRLPTFFSKVSKIFSIGHIAFIFSVRHLFIAILDSWKIWRTYDKTSGKYLEKNITAQIAIWGGVCKYITSLTGIYPTCWKNTVTKCPMEYSFFDDDFWIYPDLK